MPKVSSVFIETLKNHKVDRFFCVPGESYLPVMNELVSNPIIDVLILSVFLVWNSEIYFIHPYELFGSGILFSV